MLMLDQRLNITLLSCRGDLNFGLIGCPDRLPHLQRIAALIPEAMQGVGTGLRHRRVIRRCTH